MHVRRALRLFLIVGLGAGLLLAGWIHWSSAPETAAALPLRPAADTAHSDTARSHDSIPRHLRLNGLIEAVESVTVQAPRLSGAGGQMVITRLAAKGSHVRKGDLVIEFDRQQQARTALDKHAEWQD